MLSRRPHRSQHRYAAVLQLRLTTTGEVRRRAIGREAERIPEADGLLYTEFRLEGTKRRGRIGGCFA